MDQDHTPRPATPQVPDPPCAIKTPAGRRSRPISRPVPLPSGSQPDPHHSSTGSGTDVPRDRRRGRHRRSRLSWWWPQFPSLPVTEVTREDREALRCWLARELTSTDTSRPYIPQPRRIVVLPRQHRAPDTPVTGDPHHPHTPAPPNRVTEERGWPAAGG